MLRVTVPLVDRSYDVVVGHGAIGELDRLLPASAARVAVVTQAGIPLTRPGDRSERARPTSSATGESAKSLATIETLCRGFARRG